MPIQRLERRVSRIPQSLKAALRALWRQGVGSVSCTLDVRLPRSGKSGRLPSQGRRATERATVMLSQTIHSTEDGAALNEHAMVDVPAEALFLHADEEEGSGEEGRLRSTCTFQEAGVLTSNKGLVVRMEDGAEFQVTVVQSRSTGEGVTA